MGLWHNPNTAGHVKLLFADAITMKKPGFASDSKAVFGLLSPQSLPGWQHHSAPSQGGESKHHDFFPRGAVLGIYFQQHF